MMKFCAETTRPFGVKTIVSLNTIMVDGTGMCGGCRVRVGDKTLFTCVDGPEFDGHLVDWDTRVVAAEDLSYTRRSARWIATLRRPPDDSARTIAARERSDCRTPAKRRRRCGRRARRCRSRRRQRGGGTSTRCRWATRRTRPGRRPRAAWVCKKPLCVEGCPVNVDIPGFIALVADGRVRRGGAEDQGDQRPAGHLRAGLPAGEPVRGAVHAWARSSSRWRSAGWSASWPTTSGRTTWSSCRRKQPPTGKRVAVIGSGPAGPDRGRRPGPAGPRGDRSSRPSTSPAAC